MSSEINEPRASFTVGDGNGEDVNRTDSGEILSDDRVGIARNIFNFEADISYQLEACESYWISLHSIPSDQIADDAKYFQLGTLEYDPGIVDQSAIFTGGFNNAGEFVTSWNQSSRWDITLRS